MQYKNSHSLSHYFRRKKRNSVLLRNELNFSLRLLEKTQRNPIWCVKFFHFSCYVNNDFCCQGFKETGNGPESRHNLKLFPFDIVFPFGKMVFCVKQNINKTCICFACRQTIQMANHRAQRLALFAFGNLELQFSPPSTLPKTAEAERILLYSC